MHTNVYSYAALGSGPNIRKNAARSSHSPMARRRFSVFHKHHPPVDSWYSSQSTADTRYQAETCGISFPTPYLWSRSSVERKRQPSSHEEAAPRQHHHRSRGREHSRSSKDSQSKRRGNATDPGKSKSRSSQAEFLSRPTPVSKTCRMPSTATRKHICKVENTKKRKDGVWNCFGAY